MLFASFGSWNGSPFVIDVNAEEDVALALEEEFDEDRAVDKKELEENEEEEEFVLETSGTRMALDRSVLFFFDLFVSAWLSSQFNSFVSSSLWPVVSTAPLNCSKIFFFK